MVDDGTCSNSGRTQRVYTSNDIECRYQLHDSAVIRSRSGMADMSSPGFSVRKALLG